MGANLRKMGELGIFECGMRNAECGMRIWEWGMGNAERRILNGDPAWPFGAMPEQGRGMSDNEPGVALRVMPGQARNVQCPWRGLMGYGAD